MTMHCLTMHSVGVSEPEVLNRLVNLCCVLPIPDGDAKRHKVYTGSGKEPYVQFEKMFLYSLHRGARSRGLQARREREFIPGLCEGR